MKELTVKDHLQEMLKDPHFKETYELEHQKFLIVRKIVDYRIKHKLTQKGLAKQLKVSQQHISKIENGDFNSFSTLEKVLLGIGMSVRFQVIKLSPKAHRKIVQAMA